jgi:hypothetical protein
MNKPVMLDDIKFSDNVVNKKMYGIFVEKSSYSNESDKYEVYNGTTWPGSGYEFNSDKSTCTDEEGNTISNALTYSNGTITLNATTSAYCYIYFDLIKPDITVVLQNYNEIHNTKSLNCTTGETNSPISSYYNTKYQALVFNDVKSTATNCTLASSNSTIDSTTLSNLSSYPYYLKNKVISVAVDETSETVTNSTNVTLNAGYRYEGTNPNNYIWFNNEMWRIIGVIPTCKTSGCTTKEDLVKIIREEISVALDWHTTSISNVWNSNYSLYKVLNLYYLTRGNATGESICVGTVASDCDYRVKGISQYYRNMIENVFWNVGICSQNDTTSVIYASEILTQDVEGKVGLMNASDYGYASITRINALSSYGTYAGSNWLYGKGYEWIINSSSDYNVLHLRVNGNVTKGAGNNAGYYTRPVVYLKSSVYVVSGDGTESNPYQIAIN